MSAKRFWAGVALVFLMAIPATFVAQRDAHASGAPSKAAWGAAKPSKVKAPAKGSATKTKRADPATASDTSTSPASGDPAPAAPSAAVPDQSQEVLDLDFTMAAAIASQGPKDGYASALSDEGVLYDANGASPVGKEAATSRFGSFPADVTLVRTPERALAAGGSGSSWGTYTIKRGETILSAGRYISVWRRETIGWKMISELAAGRTNAPPPATPISGVLPKRPTSLSRPATSRPSAPSAAPSTPAPETPPAP